MLHSKGFADIVTGDMATGQCHAGQHCAALETDTDRVAEQLRPDRENQNYRRAAPLHDVVRTRQICTRIAKSLVIGSRLLFGNEPGTHTPMAKAVPAYVHACVQTALAFMKMNKSLLGLVTFLLWSVGLVT